MYSYHFMVVIPPATVIYGMLARRDRWIPIAARVCADGDLLHVVSITAWCNLPMGYEISPISQYIVQHSGPMDRVYTDEYPRIIMETGLDYGARYGTLFYFVNHDDAPKEYGDQLIADLEHRQPKYLSAGCESPRRGEGGSNSSLPMLRLRLPTHGRLSWRCLESNTRNYVKVNYDPIMVANEAILYVRKADAGTAVARAREAQLQTAQEAK